jgi:uncharacterized protein (UPF0333 family)
MLRKIISKRAQTTAEYAILIAIVVGAVVAMQVYVKRGLQGRVRDVVDMVDSNGAAGNYKNVLSGDQYEPYYMVSTANTAQNQYGTQNLKTAGQVVTGDIGTTTVNKQATTGW